jgi:hypothetical protein
MLTIVLGFKIGQFRLAVFESRMFVGVVNRQELSAKNDPLHETMNALVVALINDKLATPVFEHDVQIVKERALISTRRSIANPWGISEGGLLSTLLLLVLEHLAPAHPFSPTPIAMEAPVLGAVSLLRAHGLYRP